MYNKLMVKMATFRKEDGASMVEYALLVVLIAIVAITAITLTGNEVNSTFEEISSAL